MKILNPKTKNLSQISEERADKMIEKYRLASWFGTKKDALAFVAEENLTDFVILKGFKRSSQYDVFHN